MSVQQPRLPSGWKVTSWTREQAASMEYDASNTYPIFDPKRVRPLNADYEVWDSWLVLTENGRVAVVGGYHVLIALSQPITEPNQARLLYFYSKVDENRWVTGGHVFDTPLVAGSQEWSGSTIVTNEGELQFFYTIASPYDEQGMSQTLQRIATAKVPFTTTPTCLTLLAPTYHELLIEPDGFYYQTMEQAVCGEQRFPNQHNTAAGSNQNNNFTFRDPHYFKDPETGREYLLFEANTGTALHQEGTVLERYVGSSLGSYQPSADALKANGCIGALRLTNQRTTGRFLPPVLSSNLVTDEIERINVIYHHEHYYLFVTTHGNKMTVNGNDLVNRDFMLGWISDSLFGRYEPLNGTGVVITQKSPGAPFIGQEENEQYVYSWLVVPVRKGRFVVIAYSGYSTLSNQQTVEIRSAAPVLSLSIKGRSTRLGRTLGYIVPAESEC